MGTKSVIKNTLYLCNGENTHCLKTNCAIAGTGCCKHTDDIRYAANFEKGHTYVNDIQETIYIEKEMEEK